MGVRVGVRVAVLVGVRVGVQVGVRVGVRVRVLKFGIRIAKTRGGGSDICHLVDPKNVTLLAWLRKGCRLKSFASG